jgi:hypothetical protein
MGFYERTQIHRIHLMNPLGMFLLLRYKSFRHRRLWFRIGEWVNASW